VHFAAEFFAEQAVPRVGRLFRPAVREQRRDLVVKEIVVIGNLFVFNGEEQMTRLSCSTRAESASFASVGLVVATAVPALPEPFSSHGASTMPIFGNSARAAGGRDSMGSCRYWR